MLRYIAAGMFFVAFAFIAFAYYRGAFDGALEHSATIPVYRKASYSVDPNVDPLRASSTAEIGFVNLVFESLFVPDQHLEIKPKLLSHYSVSADGLTYSFQLKPNVIFHDGGRLDSTHVAESIDRLRSPNSPVYHRFKRIVAINIVSEGLVEVRIDAPYPPFTALLAGPMAKILKKNSKGDLIGTGPFRFDRLLKQDGYQVARLFRFDSYHEGPAKINTLELWQVDEAAAVQLMNVGKIHDTALLATLSPGLSKLDSPAVEMRSPAAITWILALNTQRFPTSDLDFRKCLRGAFDRGRFIEEFVPDHLSASGFIPPTLPGYFDFQDPGLREGQLRCNKFSGQRIEIQFPEWIGRGAEMCEHFASDFRKNFGIRSKCVPSSLERILKDISEGTNQISFLSQTLDLPEVEYFIDFFESNAPFNFSNYRSLKFDEILNRARREASRLSRAGLYKEMNELLYEDAVTINISYPFLTSYWHDCLENYRLGVMGETVIDYHKIGLRGSCARFQDFTNEDQ